MFSNIRIVLVGTTHPGNIGGVARAMKNMGLARLYLVKPKIFPCADATLRAAGADDILCSAVLCDSVKEAIAECGVVVGTSARSRSISWPVTAPRECARMISGKPDSTEVAIVFGRENSGLTNAELDLCGYWLTIPCNPDFSSLNLAAAVQVVGYELLVTLTDRSDRHPTDLTPVASSAQIESFYGHLNEVMAAVGFIHPDKSRSVMRRIRRLFNRAHLEIQELDLLRGILSAIQKAAKLSG
ncbi:MAG: tRNA (cytosine(32)/uridine(32)-2'-O)-methyltransferase TrmJ [Methylococcus sp.]|nr:MAG: tRNA (cytosine(32)/uridine(32)-2'-O)-methyltransferase TrmJ [Methylococcus sp.]